MTLSSVSGVIGISAMMGERRETGRRLYPLHEAAWVSALPWSLTGRRGDIVQLIAEDPATGQRWRAQRSDWTAEAACTRLSREFALNPLLDPALAVPADRLVRLPDGLMLLHCEPAGTPLASLPPAGLTIDTFLRMAEQAARALAALQDRRIIHGALSPATLLLTPDGRVRIAGFGQAVVRSGRDGGMVPPAAEQLLAYAAPEMLRPDGAGMDERSDLYSLGICLFQALTGRLPLAAASEGEWRHVHLAVAPASAGGLRPDVPVMVERILLTLLAKEPAERYQTAASLALDLARCREQWQAQGRIIDFIPAHHDRRDHAGRRGGLIGRTVECRALSQIHTRLQRTRQSEIVLLYGPAGAGKTSLLRALPDVLATGAAFAWAQAEPYQPAPPYGPVIQALRSLILGLLVRDPAELTARRPDMRRRLAGLELIVTALVPECEWIIGGDRPADASPRPLELAADQGPARVQTALIELLRLFCHGNQPLVLCLDDLQWADEATLGLIGVIGRGGIDNLLLVASYRDHGRDHHPPFTAFLRDFAPSGVALSRLALPPLSPADVGRLIALTLDLPPPPPLSPVRPGPDRPLEELAAIVHDKTEGNPFYIHQLLQSFIDDRLIHFDDSNWRWSWNLEAIAAQGQTDNVVDLLMARLKRLAPPERDMVCLLACFGKQADAQLFAAVTGHAASGLYGLLEPARRAGLVAQLDGVWFFAHDRVREVAYGLLPAAARFAHHGAIAEAMLDRDAGSLHDMMFDIAAQIELSGPPPAERARRIAFIAALIAAAEQAVVVASRERALVALDSARRFLGADPWALDPALARHCLILRCESLLAIGQLDQAAQEIQALFTMMSDPIDRAEAHRLEAALLTLRADYPAATRTALCGLSLLGIDLPLRPRPDDLAAAYQAVRLRLGTRPISAIVDLPLTDQPQVAAAMALLTALEAAMFYPSDGLAFLYLAVMVELTLTHGVTPPSVQGLAWFGVSLADTYDLPGDGLAFAEAALALVDRHGFERYRATTLLALDQVSVWTQPLAFALDHARQARNAGHLSAERRSLYYSCNHIIANMLAMGLPLADIKGEAAPLVQLARDGGYDDIAALVATQAEFVNALVTAGGEAALRPIGSWEWRAIVADRPAPMSTLRFTTHLLRGQLAFLRRDLETARRELAVAGDLAWSAPAHISLADSRLYDALTITQGRRSWCAGDPAQAVVERHRDRFARWAAANPDSFANKRALIDGEWARLAGDHLAAMEAYEAAAALAAAAGFTHEQALAHELAGRHADGLALATVARHHLRLAHAGYRRWGAEAKTRQLERDFSFLAAEAPPAAGASDHGLDVTVMMKAAQALSEEIVLERLIESLMRHMIIHAGASYGLLLRVKEDEARIEAVGRVIGSHLTIEVGAPTVPTGAELPLSLLFAVLRTRRPIVYGDAAVEAGFLHEAALARHPARSLLCLPLLKQGKLVAVLYLENNLAAGVFTPRTAAMLEILAPQAANALEAARLYDELLQEIGLRREAEMALQNARAELAKTAQMTVMGELAASLAHELNQPLAGIAASVGAALRWLQRDPPNIAEGLSNIADIRLAGQRAADIIRSLRVLARQAPAEHRPVVLDDEIGRVLTLIAAEIEKKQVHPVVRLGVGRLAVLADPTQLQQVVLNLVMNALDALNDQPPPRALVITSQISGPWVRVVVEDNGPGVPTDLAGQIFQPFFTTKATGMGLGLAICQSIIESHGGRLLVEPAPLTGSRFIFELPLRTAEEEQA